MRRIPSLDGLRAVSIGFVLIGHAAAGYAVHAPRLFSIFDLGNLGVRFFFVLSGFLITGLLIQELEQTGTIHLGKFYLRRLLRIFPPYYAFLAVLALWHLVERSGNGASVGCFVSAATYTSNYSECAWDVMHSWSLAVEEQFYLGWPLILLALRLGWALRTAVMLVVLAPVARLIMLHFTPELHVDYRFETTGDSLAMGCLLGGMRHRIAEFPRLEATLGSPWFVVVPLAGVAVHLLATHPSLYFNQTELYGALAPTALNLGVTLCLEWCLRNVDGRIGRLLNAKPMVLVGAMSYSLYLWQQPFTNAARVASGVWAFQFPVNLALAGALAALSYYGLEKPILRWRSRMRWLGAVPESSRSGKQPSSLQAAAPPKP